LGLEMYDSDEEQDPVAVAVVLHNGIHYKCCNPDDPDIVTAWECQECFWSFPLSVPSFPRTKLRCYECDQVRTDSEDDDSEDDDSEDDDDMGDLVCFCGNYLRDCRYTCGQRPGNSAENRPADIPTHITDEMYEMACELRKQYACPCCLEQVNKETIKITYCGHIYCKSCLDTLKSEVDSKCSVCRKSL